MTSIISNILSPLQIDEGVFGETGSYVALAARCCPLGFVVNVATYLYLSMRNDAASCEVLKDRVTLLVATNISALATIITTLALGMLGVVSPFVGGTCTLSLVALTLFSKRLVTLNKKLTLARCQQTMNSYFDAERERLYEEAQRNIRRYVNDIIAKRAV